MPGFVKTQLAEVLQIKICAKVIYTIWGTPGSVIPTAPWAVLGPGLQAVPVHSGVSMPMA